MAVEGTTFEVVVGWTAPIDIDLRDDGNVPSGTLSGTVTLIVKNSYGTAIDFTGDVSIIDATNWRIRVSPGDSDFTAAGIYRSRVKVTDSGGKVAYFPNGPWDKFVVHAEA